MVGDAGTGTGTGIDEAALVAAVEREFAAFAGSAGMMAVDLGSGAEIRVDADAETATASTIKVPILIERFRRVEAGGVDLEAKLPVTPAVRTVGSSVLRKLSDGVEVSELPQTQ